MINVFKKWNCDKNYRGTPNKNNRTIVFADAMNEHTINKKQT